VQVDAAEARLQGARAEVALAEAQAEAAEAQLDGVAAEVALAEAQLAGSEAQVEAAQARVAQTRAQLELLQAGARAEQIRAAEADAAATKAALDQAQVAVEERELCAPFGGTVASLDVKVGEAVAMGVPVAELADLSAWRIETEDLTEMDVVSVGEDDDVLIMVDALPGVEIAGEVVRIRSIGENKHGDMTYTVVVEPQGADRRLRWNMTTMVAIEPKES
jgi:HlyD family secretion protein